MLDTGEYGAALSVLQGNPSGSDSLSVKETVAGWRERFLNTDLEAELVGALLHFYHGRICDGLEALAHVMRRYSPEAVETLLRENPNSLGMLVERLTAGDKRMLIRPPPSDYLYNHNHPMYRLPILVRPDYGSAQVNLRGPHGTVARCGGKTFRRGEGLFRLPSGLYRVTLGAPGRESVRESIFLQPGRNDIAFPLKRRTWLSEEQRHRFGALDSLYEEMERFIENLPEESE